MSERNNINGGIPGSEIYQFASAEAQEKAFKGKIKQLSGDAFTFLFSMWPRWQLWRMQETWLLNSIVWFDVQILCTKEMSCVMRKWVIMHVCPVKILFRLHFLGCIIAFSPYPKDAWHIQLWPDCMDVQADLSLHWLRIPRRAFSEGLEQIE